MTDELLKEDKIAVCPVCGSEFLITSKHFIYCSLSCRKLAGGKKKGKKRSSKSKVKKCEGCGKLFQTDRYTPNQKYCSQDCYYSKIAKKKDPDIQQPERHSEPRRVVCTNCGAAFMTSRNTTLCPLCRELR